MPRTIHYHVWRRARAAYYAFGLGRLPFGESLGRAVSKWEIAHGFGDSPKAKDTWDAEYSAGSWAYIAQPQELSRYWTIIGYMNTYRKGGAYLDVGCGDGVLFDRFRPLGYERYVGIDISEVAISKLQPYNDERTLFTQADGDHYEASESFDVIVFNESLYYLRNPVDALRQYARALKPGGTLLVSTYTSSRRSLAVLRDAKGAFALVTETKTTQGAMSWLCTALRPFGWQEDR